MDKTGVPKTHSFHLKPIVKRKKKQDYGFRKEKFTENAQFNIWPTLSIYDSQFIQF